MASTSTDKVGFVQDQDRSRATLPSKIYESFNPARIEVTIESGDQEYRVQVRRQNLFSASS